MPSPFLINSRVSSGVNNRSDEESLNNRSDGSFYCFSIGVVELGALNTSETSGTLIDSTSICFYSSQDSTSKYTHIYSIHM